MDEEEDIGFGSIWRYRLTFDGSAAHDLSPVFREQFDALLRALKKTGKRQVFGETTLPVTNVVAFPAPKTHKGPHPAGEPFDRAPRFEDVDIPVPVHDVADARAWCEEMALHLAELQHVLVTAPNDATAMRRFRELIRAIADRRRAHQAFAHKEAEMC